MNKSNILLTLTILLLFAACTDNQSPDRLAQQVKKLGVYAFTGTQLSEVSVYGIEEENTLAETMSFKFTEPIPKAQSFAYFVVNMPNANISDSKVFWLPDAKEAKWHYFNPTDEHDPKSSKASIEQLSNGIYKVALLEPLRQETSFVGLWLKMPMGTPDRLYVLEVSK
jgi:hypothetical protein